MAAQFLSAITSTHVKPLDKILTISEEDEQMSAGTTEVGLVNDRLQVSMSVNIATVVNIVLPRIRSSKT